MNRAEQLRLDKGWTRKALAGRAGISVVTLRRIEAGEQVQAPQLKAVADVFENVSASDLLQPARFEEQAA